MKKVSVIIPCYNEEQFIESVIENILQQSFPQDKMETIFADGLSTDKTREIVSLFASAQSNFLLIDNPERYVPFALNKAIAVSKGEIVIRLDAHAEYAEDYVQKIIETFEKTGADIVGGPMCATGKTHFQKAVAYCTSTKFGVGDSRFHDETYEGYVDSVYLGAWKRELFNDIGMFDETLKRNQDDEFHYRAKSKGKKIYLNPEIKSRYYPRSKITELFTQYFQYGLYKPLVLKKVSSEIKARHLIPSVFVIYLISLPILSGYFKYMTLCPLLIYVAIDFCYSLRNKNSVNAKVYSLSVYPVLHIAYGIGFIVGLFKLTVNKK